MVDPNENLKEWAHGILSTPPEERCEMVGEDPSVLDVVRRYVDSLESALDALADAPEPKPCPECERLREELRRIGETVHRPHHPSHRATCPVCIACAALADVPEPVRTRADITREAEQLARAIGWTKVADELAADLAGALEPKPCPECKRLRGELDGWRGVACDLDECLLARIPRGGATETESAALVAYAEALGAALTPDRPAEEPAPGREEGT